MQMTTTKSGAVTFEHREDLRGDVTITRGPQSLTVPMDALRKLVAESVRVEAAQRLAAMKPEALLRGIV